MAFHVLWSPAQSETAVSRTLMHIIGQMADTLWIPMAENLQSSWKSAENNRSPIWMNTLDKAYTFCRCCINENCKETIIEHLSQVSFWLVTFLWDRTKFNATFILKRWYALCGTIFWPNCHGHFISQLPSVPIFTGQIRNCALPWCKPCDCSESLIELSLPWCKPCDCLEYLTELSLHWHKTCDCSEYLTELSPLM